MRKFIGTKVIDAVEMNRQEYVNCRGWELPEDENGDDEGYLVEYCEVGNSNHPNHRNYISWSPKKVFEKSYYPNNNLTFGQALELLKKGKKVARKGWNGKNMFLFLLPEGRIPKKVINDNKLKEVLNNNGKDYFDALGSIRMKTADDKILTGWLASQTDMLSNDWCLID